jgi:hypothetical protein
MYAYYVLPNVKLTPYSTGIYLNKYSDKPVVLWLILIELVSTIWQKLENLAKFYNRYNFISDSRIPRQQLGWQPFMVRLYSTPKIMVFKAFVLNFCHIESCCSVPLKSLFLRVGEPGHGHLRNGGSTWHLHQHCQGRPLFPC